MAASKVKFGIEQIFSIASRERCMSNFKKLSTPRYGRMPADREAVLVPVCNVSKQPCLLYTIRCTKVKNSGGEVSFPGGPFSKDDSPVIAALNETYREIGLRPQRIDIWGPGPPIPGQNNKAMVTPVIGAVPNLTPQDLNINSNEISEAFSVPIELLCQPKNQYYTQFSNGFLLPVFVIEEYRIWGVTAYITHAFLSSVLDKEVYKNEWMKKKITLK